MADPKTRAELVTRAAQKAQLIASGQSLEAEDQQLIDASVDAVLVDLAVRNVVYVPNDEEIDLAVFEWIADILSDAIAPDFGKPRDADKVQTAEFRLKQVLMSGPTYADLRQADI